MKIWCNLQTVLGVFLPNDLCCQKPFRLRITNNHLKIFQMIIPAFVEEIYSQILKFKIGKRVMIL